MKFIKQISTYTLVGAFGAGINFFVMPILSHYLTPADYGTLSLFNTYVLLLIPIVSLNAYAILSVDYYKQSDKNSFASQFTSLQIIPLVTTLILAVVTWLLFGRFASLLELGNTGIKWGYVILIITFLTICYEQFISFLVLRKEAGAFAIYSILKVVIEVGLTFYFIVVKKMNWEGRMYSWLITSIIYFGLGAFYFYKKGLLKRSINFSYIKEGILFGSPLILHTIGKFIINQSDRLFIIKMVPAGISEAGIYNIGYTVGSLVLILVNAFFNFYTPFLMEKLSLQSENYKLQIVRISYYYFLACIFLLLLISIFTPILFHYFIDPSYTRGQAYVFWVALGYCFWGGYMLFSGFIFFHKRNRILGWLAVFNVVTNALFNYLFIQAFGPLGAAYATALSFFLLMIIIAYQAQRIAPMPWFSFRKVLKANFN